MPLLVIYAMTKNLLLYNKIDF